jgi:hypothetical protein
MSDEVRWEIAGPVAVVTIDRPARRNAVDPATAAALAEAFEKFDADPALSVAILTGAGGTFCAGFDLKSLSEGTPNRIQPTGDGPMGPTRMTLSKPVIAAVEGYVRAAWSWRCGATSAWPRTTRCSGCSRGGSASRWWTSGRSGCPASSVTAGRWTSSSPAAP